MKKVILISLIISLVVLLSGCIELGLPNDENNDDEEAEEITITPDETTIPDPVIPQRQESVITANTNNDNSLWYWIYGTSSGYIARIRSVLSSLIRCIISASASSAFSSRRPEA